MYGYPNLAIDAEQIRKQLSVHEEMVHATIEVHYCSDAPRP